MHKRILIVFLIMLNGSQGALGLSYSHGNKIYYKGGESGLFYYEYRNNKLSIVIEKTGKKYYCLLPKAIISIANKPVGKEPIFKIKETNGSNLKTYYVQMKIGEAEYISGDIEGLYVDVAKILVSFKSQKEWASRKINVKIKYTPVGMPKMLNYKEMGIGKAQLFDLFGNYLKTIEKDLSQYPNSDISDFNVDGLEIFVSMGRICSVSTGIDQYSTSRGLKVTDSKERALELYGLPDVGYYEDDDWGYYLNRNWNDEVDYYISSGDSFTLKFKNGKVEWMSFSAYIPAD